MGSQNAPPALPLPPSIRGTCPYILRPKSRATDQSLTLQGSTYVYKTYVEPYLVQNESDIDASIASARYETLQFVQSRFSALWDIVYSLLSKTPVASSYSPSSNGTTANGSSSSPLLNQGALLQSVQGLLGAIGAPSSWAAPALPTGKPAISRSTTDTRSADNQAPFPAVPAGAPSTAGYDVDEIQ